MTNSSSLHISETPSWMRNLGIMIDPAFEKSEWFPGLLPIWWNRGKVDYTPEEAIKLDEESQMEEAIYLYENRGGCDRIFMDVINDHGIDLWRFNVRGEILVFTKEALLRKVAS